jgi:hypothetical protein
MDWSIMPVLERICLWVVVVFGPLEVRKKTFVAPARIADVSCPLVIVVGITSRPTA